MPDADGDEPPRIDSSLDPIRAAIQLVAEGSARRVMVYTPAPAPILPALRMHARAAGVEIESVDDAKAGSDLVVVPAPPRTA